MNTECAGAVYESCWQELSGRSHAENVRHTLVRAAFVDEFVGDHRVQELYQSWLDRFNLGTTGMAVMNLLDELCGATGCQRRSEFIKGLDDLESSRDGSHVTVDAEDKRAVRLAKGLSENQHLIDRLSEVLDEFQNTLETADYAAMLSEGRKILKMMDLPWDWLAIETVEFFCIEVVRYIVDGNWRETRWVAAPDPPAPAVTFRFGTRPGESAREALYRFHEEADTIASQLVEPIQFPEGRMPTDLDREFHDGVGRYGRWLYIRRVRRDSINSIARNFHSDRSTIRYGLGEAERLLSLAS